MMPSIPLSHLSNALYLSFFKEKRNIIYSVLKKCITPATGKERGDLEMCGGVCCGGGGILVYIRKIFLY
jgi:hypothetical protein